MASGAACLAIVDPERADEAAEYVQAAYEKGDFFFFFKKNNKKYIHLKLTFKF
jgi:hypothetical protein